MGLLDQKISENINKSFKDKRVTYSDAIIINSNNEILLLKRNNNCEFAPGKWCFPGGHIDIGETPDKAAIRETKEETGLTIEGSILFDTFKNSECMIYYFKSIVNEKDNIILDYNEHQQYDWFSFEEIMNLDLIMNLKDIFINWKNIL